jgi:hypothetical protein
MDIGGKYTAFFSISKFFYMFFAPEVKNFSPAAEKRPSLTEKSPARADRQLRGTGGKEKPRSAGGQSGGMKVVSRRLFLSAGFLLGRVFFFLAAGFLVLLFSAAAFFFVGFCLFATFFFRSLRSFFLRILGTDGKREDDRQEEG